MKFGKCLVPLLQQSFHVERQGACQRDAQEEEHVAPKRGSCFSYSRAPTICAHGGCDRYERRSTVSARRYLSFARVAAEAVALPRPHGSGRAEFPHPALRDTDSLRGGIRPQDVPAGVDCAPAVASCGPTSCMPAASGDRATCARRARPVRGSVGALRSPGYPVVPEVPSQLLRERLLLLLDRVVPMESAPLGDSLERPAQTVAGRLPLHHPLTLAG